MSNRRLGRGLGALLSPDPEPTPEASAEASGQTTVPLEEIHPGRHQPRRSFHEESLAELARSIKAQGMMQPVLLRPRPQGGYELVAGERRWRAAGLAGLRSVPALIKEVTDQQASVMALIENIQR
ncbi:MAG: ParB/RepB/Spo0J family partition protein [Gammaproteobacteria bacterium]|nr:ParB/RepB/Spo0J family partition protein [Gammaproteobacteria bacterium]